jgi:hypothetical protein
MKIAPITEGHYHVGTKEWKPAENEDKDYYGDGLCRTFLLKHFYIPTKLNVIDVIKSVVTYMDEGDLTLSLYLYIGLY